MENPKSAVLADIGKGGAALHHVEDPNVKTGIDTSGVSVGQSQRSSLLQEVASAPGTATLHHVEPTVKTGVETGEVHVRRNSHNALLSEVKEGVKLNHDNANPTHHGELLSEVTARAHDPHLRHVDTVDKSKPVITEDVHVKKVDRSQFLSEISSDEKRASLKHADTNDKSAPVIPTEAKVAPSPAKAMQAEFMSKVGGGQ